jgi:hypothetical protein
MIDPSISRFELQLLEKLWEVGAGSLRENVRRNADLAQSPGQACPSNFLSVSCPFSPTYSAI